MNFLIWAKDRFPILNVTTAFVMAIAAKLAAETNATIIWSLKDLATGIFVLSHLFILRVLDEHKDFASDQIYHPDRALQKGTITLKEIRLFGFAALVIEFLGFIVSGPNWISWMAFLVLWIWTALMFKEFGITEWLRKKLLIYSFSHLLISPLLFWVVFTLYDIGLQMTQQILTLFVLSLATGFLYELSRKNKSLEEDVKGELSFSLIYGRAWTGVFIAVAGIISLIAGANFLPKPGNSLMIYWVGGLLIYILSVLLLWQFYKDPKPTGRKKNEGLSGLVSIWVILFPIINFIVHSQNQWILFP